MINAFSFRSYRLFNSLKLALVLAFSISLIGCSDPEGQKEKAVEQSLPELTKQPDTSRWYSQEQVKSGRQLFLSNCAICHKADASGTEKWKELDENNLLPPPPLNGTAHAWHHPISVLLQVIDDGGLPLGGTMPAFKTVFTHAEKLSLIASFQSYWPEKVYNSWMIREEASRH